LKNRLFVVIALCGLVVGCAKTMELSGPVLPETQTPGTLYKAERVGGHSALTLRALLWWADLPEQVSVQHGVKLYRLQYWTTGPGGEAVVASGLVALPKKTPTRGVVSYQHGTNPDRHATPSRPTLGEGLLGSAIFAGGGYLFVAPDYIGLGVSQEVHPYLHAQSTANAVADLLKASHTFTAHLGLKWPEPLYLVGFSQGGHATMVAQRALEAHNDPRFQVTAAASIAGPLDLAGTSFPTALTGESGAHALYLAYLIRAYSAIYGHPIDSVVAEPYAALLPELFDGEHGPDAIIEALPTNPRDLFRQDFLDDYEHGHPTWLLDALAENEAFRWTPKAPVRLYYGEGDTDVSPKEAQAAGIEFSQRGADVTVLSVGPYEHDESVLHAIPLVRRWFDASGAQGGD